MFEIVEVAEWSKAVDSGSIPKGRGFKSRPVHFFPQTTRLFAGCIDGCGMINDGIMGGYQKPSLLLSLERSTY